MYCIMYLFTLIYINFTKVIMIIIWVRSNDFSPASFIDTRGSLETYQEKNVAKFEMSCQGYWP